MLVQVLHQTELFTALAAGTAANVIKLWFIWWYYGTDADTWVDIGSSDLPIFIAFSAGTSGVGKHYSLNIFKI